MTGNSLDFPVASIARLFLFHKLFCSCYLKDGLTIGVLSPSVSNSN